MRKEQKDDRTNSEERTKNIDGGSRGYKKKKIITTGEEG